MSACFRVFVIIIGIIGAVSAVRHEGVPKSILAQTGTAARFNCTAVHDEPVYWITRPCGSPFTHDIYIGEQLLLDGYGASGRFSVEVNRTLRRYDLVIKDVKQSDAGVYICIDQRGLGKEASAELVVWDKLSCQEYQPHDSYMGENVFGLEHDALGFTCSLSFCGNIQPHLKWSVDGRKLTGTNGTDSGTASSSLILAATSRLNGANVAFEAAIKIRSFEHTHAAVLWTSDTIQVKYAMLKKEVVMECPGIEHTLDCNPPCSYKMEAVDGTKRCAVSYETGTDVKWFYFYHGSQHNSETGARQPFFMGPLIALSCLLFIALTLTLWRLIKKNGTNGGKPIELNIT